MKKLLKEGKKILKAKFIFSIFIFLILIGKTIFLLTLSEPINLNENYDHYKKIFILRNDIRKEIDILSNLIIPFYGEKISKPLSSQGELNLIQNINEEIKFHDNINVIVTRANGKVEIIQ